VFRRNEFKQSLEYLARATTFTRRKCRRLQTESWTYYGLNRPDQAAVEWKKSLAFGERSGSAGGGWTRATLTSRERKLPGEREWHFQLKYNGTAEPGCARGFACTGRALPAD